MRRRFITLAVVLAFGAANLSYSASTGTDLVNLGSTSFSVDPSVTTATYTQSASALNFTTSVLLADTLGGLFTEQDWSSYASFGLRMSTSSTDNPPLPPLPFTVQFYDSAFNVVGTFIATTENLSLTPSVVMLGRILDGTGNFASVVGMQFTWDGAGPVDVSISEVIGFPPPTSGFFVARAPGGVRFFTSDDNNVELPAGGTAWAALSDKNAKTEVTPVDHKRVLSKLVALQVKEWSYTAAPSQRHVGPMAQDFHTAFRLGEDDRRISTIDADGVALAALKGLIAELKDREQRSADQARRLADLEAELADLVEQLGTAGH